MLPKLLGAALICCLSLLAPWLGGEPKPDADALQARTVWTGYIEGDERKPATNRQLAAMLKVTQRDGNKFQAEFVIRGRAAFALELEGVVKSGQVTAKVTGIIRGDWPDGTVDDVWTGALSGEELILKHTNKRNIVHTAKLKLDHQQTNRPNQRPRS